MRRDLSQLACLSTMVGVMALGIFVSRGHSYVHIDAIAHVNKARALLDNFSPGLFQIGTVWLPLPHLISAPLAWSDRLWSSGLAGSLPNLIWYVGTALLLFATAGLLSGDRLTAWLAAILFLSNTGLAYLFTTPMTEPLMIFCAAGLTFFVSRWAEHHAWRDLALAGLFAFCGTWTRYEGWVLAAAMVPIIAVISRRRRIPATILFAGMTCLGPVLWMFHNWILFEDPLIFMWGRGSAADYAFEHLLRTGHRFPAAGDLGASLKAYWIDVAYCLTPTVLFLSLPGLAWSPIRAGWRKAVVPLVTAGACFSFYAYSLYSNTVPILLPGMLKEDPNSIYNVRYGAIMAATLPVFAALVVGGAARWSLKFRPAVLLLALVFLIPDPVPMLSRSSNLFYIEGVRNQAYWMPAFVDIGRELKAVDDGGLILAGGRIMHVVVWATGIPIRRIVHEMNKAAWDRNVTSIDLAIRWVITEEGDQMWNAHKADIERDFIEVARRKALSSGIVHLFKRRQERSGTAGR